MKKYKYIILLALLGFSNIVNAQLVKIEKINVPVCYHKTVHLIFPSSIAYFNSVGDIVAADQPEGVPFVLRIKANSTHCGKQTTLSVATQDGKFYDFAINQAQDIFFTNLYLDTYKWEVPQTVYVNDSAKVHLVFPDVVKYVDIGDICVESTQAKGTQNILSLKAQQKGFKKETNISVITRSNSFYSYNIAYAAVCPVHSYYANEEIKNRSEQVILPENTFTDGEVNRIMNQINSFPRKIHSLGIKKDGILFSVLNVFIHKNRLLFRLELGNRSSIPYEIEYMKFNIIDKKTEKLTATQEVEQPAIFLENFGRVVDPQSRTVFVAGFDKFTIPDDKFLQIEINEKNGGRHVLFKIQNKDIIGGQVF